MVMYSMYVGHTDNYVKKKNLKLKRYKIYILIIFQYNDLDGIFTFEKAQIMKLKALLSGNHCSTPYSLIRVARGVSLLMVIFFLIKQPQFQRS